MRTIDADALMEAINAIPINILQQTLGKGYVDRAIMDAPTVGDWINVKDRLPDEEDCYLAYGPEGSGCDILFYDAANGNWISMGHVLADGEVTHWMPLPEPPKEESKK